MPCSEEEWSAQCLFLFHLDVLLWTSFQNVPSLSHSQSLVCTLKNFRITKLPTHVDDDHILSSLLFIHAKDRYYNLGWIGVQMTFLLLKNPSLHRREMNVFTVLHESKKALMVINFISSSVWFTALSSCHRMCVWEKKKVETDIPERHRYVDYWSLKNLTS